LDPRNLFARCRWQADKILKTVKDGRHRSGQREVWDFPFLRGEKIGPLWLRMLRDNVGLSLDNMDRIPIPTQVLNEDEWTPEVVKTRQRNLLNKCKETWDLE